MKPALLFFTLLVTLSSGLQAQVYRCDNNGSISFSDQPCSGDSSVINIRDNRIGGSFNQNIPEPAPQSEKPEQDKPDRKAEQASACRFINSTDLRTYLVRNQVVKGMTQDNVRRAFGNPPETHAGPQEVWIYQTRYYGALYELTYVYFRDGCVDRVEYRKP